MHYAMTRKPCTRLASSRGEAKLSMTFLAVALLRSIQQPFTKANAMWLMNRLPDAMFESGTSRNQLFNSLVINGYVKEVRK